MRLTMQLAALLLAGVLAGNAGADDNPVEDVQSAEERFRALMAEGRNAEAESAARNVVDITQQLHGEGSVELAGPLTNLATAQLRNGDLRNAEFNYQSAIALLEKHEGFLSVRLINPLIGLGETYIRDEQYSLATEVYEKALHINHVNEGLYNPEQGVIRDGLTEGYLGLQDLEQANLNQDAQVYARQRRLGPEDPELIAAYTKLGQWYTRSNQPELAQLAYQNAARLAEATKSSNSPLLTDLLLAVARTYRDQALLPLAPDSNQSAASLLAMSSMTLRKALDAVDQAEPPDPAQRARIFVELGDLNLMLGKRKTASNHYRDAWEVLSATADLAAQRDRYFAEPVRIMGPVAPAIFPVPSRKAPAPPRKDLEPGFVVVRYDVDELGRVLNPTVIEADPSGLLEKQVTEALERNLYRPRYEGAEPVATQGLIYRHEFRYLPAKLEPKDSPPAEDTDRPLEQPSSGDGS
jgi:tetratricopeptide (TPR) repeat protein